VAIKNIFRACIISLAFIFLLNLYGCASSGNYDNNDNNDNNDTTITVPTVPTASGILTISVLKAGQADAIVITTQNSCMVIDCGEKDDADKVLQYLKERNIKTIDYLVITHFDKDHVGGAAKILSNVTANIIYVPDYKGNTDEYKKYINALEMNSMSQTAITENVSFLLDDVLFEIYSPLKTSYRGDNDYSLVVLAKHGNLSFLFAGDAESERISELMEQLDGNYDYFKVPHHGRFDDMTSEFINFVNPSIAVITDSEKNPADDRTIESLSALGCEVYCTKDGTVTAISDGSEITVELVP